MIRLFLSAILAGSVQNAHAAEAVVDYRDSSVRRGEASTSPAEQARLARAIAEEAPSALRTELGPSFVVLGSAAGAFTQPGRDERIYLVQEKRPVAIEPFPNAAAPVLVVVAAATQARFFRLPKDVQYQRVVRAVDADRDGRSEVLLESAFTNMGESVTALTAIKLDPVSGSATPIQILRDVFADNCQSGAARKSRTAASVVLDASGTFVAQRHELRCR